MATEPLFQLTTRDHAILEAMLERHRGPHGPFARLLERKLRASAIAFREDIPPGVVTLGSRVGYLVDGRPAGPHLLVEDDADAAAGHALSIRTIRGLALLGLSVRAEIVVDLGEDVSETLRVEAVAQPPAPENTPENTTVVRFRPRAAMPRHPGPEDDDPGPRAA